MTTSILQEDEFSVIRYGEPSPSLHPLSISKLAYERATQDSNSVVRKCKSIVQTETHVIVSLLVGRSYKTFRYAISEISSPRYQGVKLSSNEIAELRGFAHCTELFDAAKFIADELGYTVGCYAIEYKTKYSVELVKDGISKYFTITF